MTLGFAFILYHVITQPSFVARFLSGRIMVYLGKISYSIYLWHSLAFIILWKLFPKSASPLNVLLVFAGVGALSVLLASISYKYLESFYFKKRTAAVKMVKVVSE